MDRMGLYARVHQQNKCKEFENRINKQKKKRYKQTIAMRI